MRKLCVIGDPIAHSLSPAIQNAMIRAAGLDCTYGARQVPADGTRAWLEQALAEGYAGFNATMPHKEKLVPLMDSLSPDGARFGAVNTVCIKNGELYGYNTDGDGFLRAVREVGLDPAGRSVLVLGAGGAARAVVPKLLQGGAERVFVANRTPERARELCRREDSPRLEAADFSGGTLRALAARCSLAVNCTSLGMTGTAGQFEDLSFVDGLSREGGVFDLIYSPRRTALLERAERAGVKAVNGLDMLLWQAVYALELFAEVELDGPAMVEAARAALEGKV